jgi:hypothetical protein
MGLLGGLWRFGRRLLGRRGTFMLRNTLATITTTLGIVKAEREGKADGITAMVCTFNEEEWIEPSLLSVKDLVDEYVVVDSSTDSTPKIVEKLIKEHGLPVRLYRVPPGDLTAARNLALREARYRWVLFWDADFVATDKLIRKVREFTENWDRKSYYLVYWPYITFCGDIYHLCPRKLHVEHWLYTWSRRLRYTSVRSVDVLIAQLYMYKVAYFREPLGYHFTAVRRPERLYFKYVWWKYREKVDALMKKDLGEALEFAKKVAEAEHGTRDLYEAGLKHIHIENGLQAGALRREPIRTAAGLDSKVLPREDTEPVLQGLSRGDHTPQIRFEPVPGYPAFRQHARCAGWSR